VRLLLAQGHADEAERLLRPLAESASGFGYAFLRVRLLQALAICATGKAPRDQACAYLLEALSLAQPAGARRCFLDLGAPLAQLLIETRARIPRPELAAYANSLLSALRLAGAPEEAGDEAPLSAESLVEPLSDRELEVLRLLVAGLSNNEIATRLYIAVGTAKTHINHIFGKLGVTTRTQAIARARELGFF
jgi:LuxR family transcriptional regulator, maltose regulon positive regulatory protein